MMRRSRRTRLGKKLQIEAVGGVVEVVPEAEGEAASEAVDGDVEVEEVSRLESWQRLLQYFMQRLYCVV
jgi:hypothetical protein